MAVERKRIQRNIDLRQQSQVFGVRPLVDRLRSAPIRLAFAAASCRSRFDVSARVGQHQAAANRATRLESRIQVADRAARHLGEIVERAERDVAALQAPAAG